MKKYISILFLAGIATGLTSCLKDDNANITPDSSPAVVEFSSATLELPSSDPGSIYALYERAFDISPSIETSYDINYTGGSVAPRDIKVTIGLKPEAIQEYMDEQDPDHENLDFEILPTEYYNMPTEVTIPKGQKKVRFNVTLNTSLITDFNAEYVLPISITNADGMTISGNYGTVLTKVSVKNKYDGIYNFSGQASGSPDRTNVYQAGTFTWPGQVDLRTSGPNTVDIYDRYYNWGGGLNQWLLFVGASATTGGGFGQVRPRFTLDLTTNKVTAVTNMYPNPTNGRQLAVDPTYDGKYDPETKTLDFRFLWTQPNFTTTTVVYHLVYARSR